MTLLSLYISEKIFIIVCFRFLLVRVIFFFFLNRAGNKYFIILHAGRGDFFTTCNDFFLDNLLRIHKFIYN